MEMYEIWNWNVLTVSVGIRYLVNLLAVIILVRGIYYRNYRRSDLFLSYFAFNSIIFFVAYMLNKVEMSTGAAFGLFAVFSILRYRTDGISAKDMTYLFLSIAIGLLSAVSKGNWIELSLICLAILLVTFLLESSLLTRRESSKIIFYDNIKLVHTNEKEALLTDLRNRTGLNIQRFEINDIDFLRDACRITIYYYEN